MAGAGADAGTLPPWPAGAAWIDGRYGPIEDAKISVLDLGLVRSDCSYDVVHVWRGRFYQLDAHLDRFAASLARLRLDPGRAAPRSRPCCMGASAMLGCGRRTYR